MTNFQESTLITLAELIAKYGRSIFQEMIAEASKNRRNAFFQELAQYCLTFLRSYENFNYDSESNGESFVLKVIAQAMSPTSELCIFDVGANVGNWSVMTNQILPKSAKIHAFEIVPSTFELLKKTTHAYPNIIANNYGLSDRVGEIQIRYFPENNTLTTAIADYPHPYASEMITGKAITGEAYMKVCNIEHIHFLKLDVEGSEHLVLNGFSGAINRHQIDVIQFEYGKLNILTRVLLGDFYKFFDLQGYKVGKIYPNYVEFREYKLEHEDFLGPNYIAVCQENQNLIDRLSVGIIDP